MIRLKEFIFCLLLFNTVTSQATETHSEDHAKYLNSFFQSVLAQESLNLTIKINVYSKTSSSKPFLTFRATLKKQGSKVYQAFGRYQSLITPKSRLIVDGKKRVIRYFPMSTDPQANTRSTEVENQMGLEFIPDLKAIGRIEKLPGSGGERKHFIIYNPKGLIEKTEMFVDPEKMIFTKLIYHYRKNNPNLPSKAILEYQWSDEISPRSPEIEEEFFIMRQENKVVPSLKYRGYQIISNKRNE